jgi:hypothetical protein
MTKHEIQIAIKKWQNILGLSNWNIVVQSKKDKNPKGNFVTAMTTEAYPDYCTATIKAERPKIVEEADIVHELVHVLISELVEYSYPVARNKRKWFDYMEERVVSQITQIIMRSYE